MSLNLQCDRIEKSGILPMVKVGCYAGAGFLVGRKLTQAAVACGFKVGGQAASYFNNELAIALNAKGERYLRSAKKGLADNIILAVELIATGCLLQFAEDTVSFCAAEQNAYRFRAGNAISSTLKTTFDDLSNVFTSASRSLSNLVYGNQRHPYFTSIRVVLFIM